MGHRRLNLYTVAATLAVDGAPVHDKRTRIPALGSAATVITAL